MSTLPNSQPAYSMTDRQSSVLRKAALERVAKARAAAPGELNLQHLEEDVSEFYDTLDAFERTEAGIRVDPHLSPEGKKAKHDRARADWEATSAAQLESIRERVERIAKVDPAKVTPRPPVEDPAVLEAKLANARSDARMLLDRHDLNTLPDRMRELVQHDADPVVSYLLVATPWGANYIHSRLPNDNQQHGAPVVWDRYRTDLTRGMLDEAGQRAYDRARALEPLPQVTTVVHHTREHRVRDRSPR